MLLLTKVVPEWLPLMPMPNSPKIRIRAEVESALERIYARIPKLACRRKCQESCGPILCHAAEWARMKAATLVPIDQLAPDLTCPALLNGACSVYSVRPLICRLWGVVRAMACPWGCEPERWLTDAEADALFSEVRSQRARRA